MLSKNMSHKNRRGDPEISKPDTVLFMRVLQLSDKAIEYNWAFGYLVNLFWNRPCLTEVIIKSFPTILRQSTSFVYMNGGEYTDPWIIYLLVPYTGELQVWAQVQNAIFGITRAVANTRRNQEQKVLIQRRWPVSTTSDFSASTWSHRSSWINLDK